MRSTRQVHPRCEHFAFSCFSYLILSSFVSPLLPLGLGLLLVRGYVRRPMYCRMGLLVLQLFAVSRYGHKFSSSSTTG